jgi:hypothetical protein
MVSGHRLAGTETMANLFLGFPVPRAKIADMISGQAPPALHKTQHQLAGTDELDLTGLTGAAAGISFDDFIMDDCFPSLDAISVTKSGAEAVTIDYLQLSMDTLVTAGSYITCYKAPSRDNPILTWSKARKLRTAIWIQSITNALGNLFVGIGYWGGTDQHVGFLVADGVLKGSVGNGSANYLVTLATLGTGAYSSSKRLFLDYTPADKCDFYVDDVLLGTINTPSQLPAGTTFADAIISIDLRNNANAKQLKARFSTWKMWQAA